MSTHPPPEELAALLDAPGGAAAAGHVVTCAECTAVLDHMRQLSAQLALPMAPDLGQVKHTLAKIARTPHHPQPAWWLGGIMCTAALGMVLLGLPPSTVTPRGSSPVQSVAILLVELDGAAAMPLRNGDTLRSRSPRLMAQVSVLPQSSGGWVAVFARDAAGRVTWLLPTWTQASQVPNCVALPRRAGIVGDPMHAVELPPGLGNLQVGLLRVDQDCNVATLDERLEAGWAPPASQLLSNLELHFPEAP